MDSICPVCAKPSHEIFRKHNYPILDCENCKHRFCGINPPIDHVSMIYGDSYFFEGGSGYANYLAEANLLIEHGKYYAKLLRDYMEPGKILDVGSAAGFILDGFQKYGWVGYGLEPNKTMSEYAQSAFKFKTQMGTLENYETNERFKLINMIQVIPHFHDLKQALRRAVTVTEDNGFWLIETWNYTSFMAKLFGQNWHEYSPPSVLHWFSPSSLDYLTHELGFTEIARGRPPKWLKGSHAKSLLTEKLTKTPIEQIVGHILSLVPDSLRIPYPSFDLFWVLYQKSV